MDNGVLTPGRHQNTDHNFMKLVKVVFDWLLAMVGVSDQIYRRTMGKSVWHFSTRCEYWPTENFEEVTDSPRFGICPICRKAES